MGTPLLIFPYNGNALEALDALGDDFELIEICAIHPVML
jgi:hypothetical protein